MGKSHACERSGGRHDNKRQASGRGMTLNRACAIAGVAESNLGVVPGSTVLTLQAEAAAAALEDAGLSKNDVDGLFCGGRMGSKPSPGNWRVPRHSPGLFRRHRRRWLVFRISPWARRCGDESRFVQSRSDPLWQHATVAERTNTQCAWKRTRLSIRTPLRITAAGGRIRACGVQVHGDVRHHAPPAGRSCRRRARVGNPQSEGIQARSVDDRRGGPDLSQPISFGTR